MYKTEDTESRQSKSLPTSAPLNNLIKSGLTLTQMYTKFVEVYNYLRVEKQEKENFKILLEAVLDVSNYFYLNICIIKKSSIFFDVFSE